jgi:prepilin-type N-terminal cleavage/methylation domain-containing protein
MIKQKGLTAIEVLMALSILAVIFGITLFSISSLKNDKLLEQSYITVVSTLERARFLSINSKDFSEYGVQFAEDEVNIFKGKVFSEVAITETIPIESPVSISLINLSGGVDNFFFEKITGNVSATGTILLEEGGDNEQKTITIYSSGVVE